MCVATPYCSSSLHSICGLLLFIVMHFYWLAGFLKVGPCRVLFVFIMQLLLTGRGRLADVGARKERREGEEGGRGSGRKEVKGQGRAGGIVL